MRRKEKEVSDTGKILEKSWRSVLSAISHSMMASIRMSYPSILHTAERQTGWICTSMVLTKARK